MKSKLLILILVAVLAGLGILKVGFDTRAQIGEVAQVPQIEIESRVTLVIDKESPIEKEVDINPGDTVFDLLEEGELEFDYEEYESGVFITSIEGVSSPNKNWMYYVNGKLGKVAVDQKRIGNGDLVKFKNQKSPF